MKPVIVKVKSVQRNEEGEELAIELVSEGKAYKKERTQYIVYEESELTDMEGVTTVIKSCRTARSCCCVSERCTSVRNTARERFRILSMKRLSAH